MTAHRSGGWHRTHKTPPEQPRTAAGEFTIAPPKPVPPRTSWWTKPVPSREAFDRLVRDRWRGTLNEASQQTSRSR